MVTISIYLLKGPCESYINLSYFESVDSDYIEWACPLNSPLRKKEMTKLELDKLDVDTWTLKRIKESE